MGMFDVVTGALAVGATGASSAVLASKPVTIEISWNSYHIEGFWTHSMYVDGLRYASLCWLKYDTKRGKVFALVGRTIISKKTVINATR